MPDIEGMQSCTCSKPQKKKLVLCFDGTGNTFTGSSADTNVVKILNELDRGNPNQYFYYQTGIGTYDINETSVNKTWLGGLRSNISQTLDSGFGTTFDAHVMAGYRFLMRYYDTGDKIYMFGFSRGAFTAKFLARMVSTVGLLCKGNEEMVPFAYLLYQKYLSGEIATSQKAGTSQASDSKGSQSKVPNGVNGAEHEHDEDSDGAEWQPLMAGSTSPKDVEVGIASATEESDDRDAFELASDEVKAFSKTFCRQELVRHCNETKYANVKVFFLGIWDCVSSVAVLEREAPKPMPVVGTANFVRHAVAVDERRVKFKPALLSQDIPDTDDADDDEIHEDVKEVWFPGNHGDVGGGWPPAQEGEDEDLTFWQRVKRFWTTRKAKKPTSNILADHFQLSDIPLAWMIREVRQVGQDNPDSALKFRKDKYSFMSRFEGRSNPNMSAQQQAKATEVLKEHQKEALHGFIHDTLSLRHGSGFVMVMFWKFMEYFPLIKRWELVNDKWENIRFPLNGGATRDIPKNAVLHYSVLWRLKNLTNVYKPLNNHGSDGTNQPCLRKTNNFKECPDPKADEQTAKAEEMPVQHKLYQFEYSK